MALGPNSDIWNYFNNIKEEGIAECKLCKQRLKNNRSYNLKLHVKAVHRNKIEVEKYFEINGLENLATCRTCNHRLKNRLCNLRLHMRRSHKIELVQPADKPFPKPYDEDQIEAVLKIAKRKITEPEFFNDKRTMRHLYIRMDKKTIVRSVIGLVVEDGISPQLLSSKHIDAILHPMCEAISDQQISEFKMDEAEVEEIINFMANHIRNDFSNILDCRLLSIKIDTDLNASPDSFCVSAQFIKDGEIQKLLLGIIDLKNDNELKEDHVKNILYKFNIDSNQIISASWDNTKLNCKKHIKNSDYFKEIEKLKLYPEIFVGDVKIEPYLSSIAQICLLDIFKNSIIFQRFLECRNVVNFINDKINGYFQLFEIHNISLPQLDSPWNAGSTCKMMNDLFAARQFLQTFKFENCEKAEDQFDCNEELWSFIEAFCIYTTYLQKSILKFQSEERHIGDFYAQWLKCKLLTEKFFEDKKESSDGSITVLEEVVKAIENKTNELLSQDRVVACLFLDPRFQRLLHLDQKTKAVEYLKKLWCHAKLYIYVNAESNETVVQLYDDDEDTFLNEFLSHDIQVKREEGSDVFQKIEQLILTFQTADTNILSFWRDLKTSDPEIYALSTICFAIPATEIYDKIRYSHIYRLDAKSDLSSYTRENLLNMRLNAHLIDDALAYFQLTKDKRSNAGLFLSDTEISRDGDSNTASTLTVYKVVSSDEL